MSEFKLVRPATITSFRLKHGVSTQEVSGGVILQIPAGVYNGPSPLEVLDGAKRKRSYNPKTHKRCVVCREIKTLENFGHHGTASTIDNKQVVCRECKNARGKERQNMNVKARLRHHIATRVLTQLGKLAPEGITASLEEYLGYRIVELVRELGRKLREDYPDKSIRLRDALNMGWHVDHIYPLSKFKVVVDNTVDWQAFQECWAVNNLRAIPAEVNLAKGAKVVDADGEKPF